MTTRNDWLTRVLPTVALVAFLVVAATTEYSLAHDVMRLPWAIAAGVPVAIDCYVVAAFRAGRDVRLAMFVTAASLAAATGWHMATSGTDDWARFALAGLVLMLLVVVLWRTHVIAHAHVEAEATAAAEEDARRAAAAQEEANRLEAARQQLERDALALRERELAEQVEQRKAAERADRRQERATRPKTTREPETDAPAGGIDPLEPVVWEIANEREAAGLGRIARDTPKSGAPLGLKDELKARGYGVSNARAGALLKKVYGDTEVRT